MSHRALLERLLNAFTTRDLEAVMACFNTDAVVFDPHYPIAEMKGSAAIRRGFNWALGNMERPGFELRHFWSDGQSGAIEVDTHHVFKGGMEVRFNQVFVFEIADGKLAGLRAYAPYPPTGIAGVLVRLSGVAWRIKGTHERTYLRE